VTPELKCLLLVVGTHFFFSLREMLFSGYVVAPTTAKDVMAVVIVDEEAMGENVAGH
jgi:hypothetical protein